MESLEVSSSSLLANCIPGKQSLIRQFTAWPSSGDWARCTVEIDLENKISETNSYVLFGGTILKPSKYRGTRMTVKRIVWNERQGKGSSFLLMQHERIVHLLRFVADKFPNLALSYGTCLDTQADESYLWTFMQGYMINCNDLFETVKADGATLSTTTKSSLLRALTYDVFQGIKQCREMKMMKTDLDPMSVLYNHDDGRFVLVDVGNTIFKTSILDSFKIIDDTIEIDNPLLWSIVEEYVKEECAPSSDVLAAWGVILDMCVALVETQELDAALDCQGINEIFEDCLDDNNYDSLNDILEVVDSFKEDSEQLKVTISYIKSVSSLLVEEDTTENTQEEIALKDLSIEAEQKEEGLDIKHAAEKQQPQCNEVNNVAQHAGGEELPIAIAQDEPHDDLILL